MVRPGPSYLVPTLSVLKAIVRNPLLYLDVQLGLFWLWGDRNIETETDSFIKYILTDPGSSRLRLTLHWILNSQVPHNNGMWSGHCPAIVLTTLIVRLPINQHKCIAPSLVENKVGVNASVKCSNCINALTVQPFGAFLQRVISK